MTYKDIAAKIAKNEALTDEERKFLADYDPDKAANDAAAAARRKAEQKAEEAEARLKAAEEKAAQAEAKLAAAGNAGKSEIERLRADFAEAAKKLAGLQEQVQRGETEKAALIRRQTLGEIRRKAGIQFANGLDHGMLERSFEGAFEGVTDLADENVVKLKLGTWAAMNKAAILDQSGHGSGGTPHTPAGAPLGLDGKPVEQMTAEERRADLHKRGIT
jgi:hypothetical protein